MFSSDDDFEAILKKSRELIKQSQKLLEKPEDLLAEYERAEDDKVRKESSDQQPQLK